MFESRAIGRYIATLGSGTQLIPSDPKAHAKFEQAASIEYSHFDPLASIIVREKVFKPRFGQATDEKLVEELSAQLEKKLDAYEVILGKQKYLAGNVRSPFENKPRWVWSMLMGTDRSTFHRRLRLQICTTCHMVAWPLSSGMGA